MSSTAENPYPLSHSDLLRLQRWNTPTIYNGWEQITKRDPAADGFNLEQTHGFLTIEPEEAARLLDAAEFMDANECQTVIAAARAAAGKPMGQVLDEMAEAGRQFAKNTKQKFSRQGEW
jgi:hypothetical protein